MSKSKRKNKKQVREAMKKFLNYESDFSYIIKDGDVVFINVENILSRKDKFNEKYLEFVKSNTDVKFIAHQYKESHSMFELEGCPWIFHYTDLILVEED